MYADVSKRLVLTDRRKKTLQSVMIDDGHPGTVLHDFNVLLDILRADKPILTDSHQLPFQVVSKINARLKTPLQLDLKRATQKSYPPIHGLYLLVRASGLTYVDSSGKKPVVVVNENVYAQWLDLNPTERFGVLLDAWLLRGHGEIIGERGRHAWMLPDNFEDILRFLGWHDLEAGLQVAGNKSAENSLKYTPSRYNLGLLDLFGIIAIQSRPSEPNKGWQIEHIRLTSFGSALLSLLWTNVFRPDVLYADAAPEALEEDIGTMRSMLKPYFPAWQHKLIMPKAVSRKGAHIFKVSLGDIWRRIAIDGKQSLDNLAEAILTAVDFDSDHLYEFSYRNRYGTVTQIHPPYTHEPLSTSEVLIKDVPLNIGQSMTFLFDFGDDWNFNVLLEAVEPDRIIEHAAVLEEHGESPDQYPGSDWDWDEGEYEDDYEDKGENE